MGDWLGTGMVASRLRKYRSFKQARKFVHTLKLKTPGEWRLYCSNKLTKRRKQKPLDIPSAAERIYEDKGWVSWPDWLGTVNKKKSK